MASNNLLNSSKNDRIPTNADASAPAEFSVVVDDLLNTLSNKFAGVSSEIFAKMDEMSRRLDDLETSLKNNTSTENESPQK
ncbi:putative heat shock factor-binding protein [Erysiphe neolycopersici]|uniref:Putative heat shock factor-binding protein n=1 Tax=Erysiphe neolycopersici TaxID=212602 RepID=A0A420HT17_9PEZI|nr:putative heat shock factor-binding protein [Erysiphe neolycopersici]